MRRALLVIDVQNEYFTGKLPISYPENSFEHILEAMDAAAENEDCLIILVQHTAPAIDAPLFARDTDSWQIHPDVAERYHDMVIEKHMPGSFTGTGLEECLRSCKVDAVTICGYMTHMCCDSTARQATHLGFKVEFLSDATGTVDISNNAGAVSAEELHRAILVTQASRFSRVTTTAEWIASLD